MRTRALRRSEGPKTPEPTSQQGDCDQPPSPPRQRFRLKRRNAPQHNMVPTQQFLASVAAADMPIPSIEEPFVVDEDMVDTAGHAIPLFTDPDNMDISHSVRGRPFSPPKTPAPDGLGLSLSPNRFPDWSIDSSLSESEGESSRPSTARSTQTSASVFSQLSFTSDGPSCVSSPFNEHTNQFDTFLTPEDANKVIRAPVRAAKSRKAPWTQPMDKHLWSTYMMYLQDPKVTPVRIGASGVPPYGVVVRVAREARRSWKGSKPQPAQVKSRSGSSTPTAEEAPCTFVQWPHTQAATRAHLIEMCKANSGGKTRNERYFASSPTPFGKSVTRSRARRATPARSPSVFSSSDMAMSLVLSTADSMQLGGPLAQLTSSKPQKPVEDIPVSLVECNSSSVNLDPLPDLRPRLGSPFVAKSYGPSSSSSLADVLGMGSELPRQSHTVGPRRSSRTPARLNRSRSNTQKRRSGRPSIELRRSKRPSLPSDMWSEPSTSPMAPASDFNDLMDPQNNKPQQPSDPTPSLAPAQFSRWSTDDAPARLGSPFNGLPASFSYPARGAVPAGINFAIRRPFATVQESLNDDNTPRIPLPARLAYLDERLKQIRRRGEERRRSESPL
ncbi:hypothetical protein ACO1O0_000618 [Amphichorda felina]